MSTTTATGPLDALLGDASVAVAALAAGAVTSVDLVTAALAAADQVTGLAAICGRDDDRALAAARRVDERRAAGEPLGPLAGVPVLLKDNVAERGVPNRAASLLLPDVPAPADGAVTARLRAAGAVLVGRTNMHELAWGGTTDNPHLGTCRNPWDPGRIPAGSSGGTGAAVAAGVAPVGIGTDTGGSIRLPSSVANLTGLRPTLGRVPTTGVVPLAWTLDTIGPMGRSAADCRLVLDATEGPDGLDDGCVAHPEALAHLHHRPDPWSGLRVGVVRGYSLEGVQPAVAAAVGGLVDDVVAWGARRVDVTLPHLDEMVDALVVINAAEASAVHAAALRERPEVVGADVRVLLEAGERFTVVEYLAAQRLRTGVRDVLASVWQHVDVLVLPTLPFTAPRIGERDLPLAGRTQDVLVALMRYTALASLTGSPGLSLPCGLDPDGLPVGAQLVGPAWSDRALLHLAEDVQRRTDHHRLSRG